MIGDMRNTWLAMVICGLLMSWPQMSAAEKDRDWQSGHVVESKASVGPQIHTITGKGKNYLVRGSAGTDEDDLAVGATVRFAVEGKAMYISLGGKEYRLTVIGETLASAQANSAAPAATAPAPRAPQPPPAAPVPPAPPAPAKPAARVPQTAVEPPQPGAPAAKAAPAASPALDNDAIVKMILAGLKDDTISRVIAAQPGNYVLTPEAITGLKAAGVSANLIAAMSAKMNAER